MAEHVYPQFQIRRSRERVFHANNQAHHRHLFTFLPWAHGPPADVRFQQMANAIQNYLPAAGGHHWGFRFYSADAEAPAIRNTTLLNVHDVDLGLFLIGFFERMVQSGTVLRLEGFTVSVEDLGPDLPRLDQGGMGKPTGVKFLPDILRGQGLSEHPRFDRLSEEERKKNCGFRALVLARWGADGLRTKSFVDWQTESAALAQAIGNTDGCMRIIDITAVLAVQGWTRYRIVVLNTWRRIQFADKGADWVWPVDHPHREPEPNTLHILWDNLNSHYHWIQSPKRFVAGHTSNSGDYLRCMACFRNIRIAHLSDHGCDTAGKYQCTVCLEVFSCEEALEMHRSLRNANYPRCEVCHQTTFNGELCYERHKDTNCHPADFLPRHVTRERCDSCRRNYRSDRNHRCTGFTGRCPHCQTEFDHPDQLVFHRCPLHSNTTFWEPLVEKRKDDELVSFTWNSHYFYDFETCKETELSTNSFELGVMAWCIRLMLPDDRTTQFVVDNDICNKLIERCKELDAPDVWFEGIWVRDGIFSVRILGKELKSFVAVVEHALCRSERKQRWLPTLWAHNGSKFDAKFVFDYYVNEMKLDLAGSKYDFIFGENGEPVRDEEGEIKWKPPKTIRPRRDVIKLSSVGSKILSLKVQGARFCCSHAHHPMALRNLPKVFGLQIQVKKGEFPYCRLKRTAWDDPPCRTGLPHLAEYETDSMMPARRREVILWWMEDQVRRWAPPDFILQCLDDVLLEGEDRSPYDNKWLALDYLTRYEEKRKTVVRVEPVGWKFEQELWAYLKDDVDVGALCMEAYHRAAEEMHPSIWEITPNFEHRTQKKIVSPLDCATAPSWAHRLYTTWFMPPHDLVVLTKNETRFVRDALRGGRTDKRANWVELTEERRILGDRIVYVDFKSLYPSVQKHDIHGTHFPIGQPEWFPNREIEVNNDSLHRLMGDLTGFLRVTTVPCKYVTHPTLHQLRQLSPDEKAGLSEPDSSKKLVFSNEPAVAQTYAWPELLEAMDSGEVEVTHLHEALRFRKGTQVFDDYVAFFFRLKEHAERTGNKGLRALAKLLLNSLWGKLGQRSYPVREWVTWGDRLDYLWKKFESGQYTVLDFRQHEPHRVWIQYRDERDVNNANATAPHVAAFVSTWGRVQLHKKLLRQHGQRALYCDTDSAIVYLRADDKLPYVGSDLGDLTQEVPKILEDAGYDLRTYPDPFIREAVFVAPKTYALKICHIDPPLTYFKVVCKGFEPSFKNAKELHFRSMKELVWTQNKLKQFMNGTRELDEEETNMQERRYIRDAGRMQFVSHMCDIRVRPVQRTITKQLNGVYTKGKTVPWEPRLVQPFGDWDPPHQTFLDFADDEHYE